LAQRPRLECKLTVVGGGSLLPKLRSAAEGDARIHFAGALTPAEVAAAYSSADVFLFPSRQDVFGLALVEAMHAGLATVSALAPGAVADLCVHEENCLLVPDHDPTRWADAIERVTTDTSLRRRLGAAARETVRRRWTTGHSADAFVAGVRLGQLVGATGR
jgi:glycosyltransferase involved in cell wall biosynthesis